MPSADDKRVLVRMPQELADRLTEIAERKHRSFNAQVVYLLERATAGWTTRGNATIPTASTAQTIAADEDLEDIAAADAARVEDPEGLPLATARAAIKRMRDEAQAAA